MKIGVIGIGNIAQKAYLPLYSASRDQGGVVFATSNPKTKEMLASRYGFTNCVGTLDELLAQNIQACMIHAATQAHGDYIRRCLTAGVHVFVDKPISEDPREVAELLDLAKAQGLILMAGFNRRFAPLVAPLQKAKDKHLLVLQKHRINHPQPVKFVTYDLFLHVIDTAIYLLDEEIEQVYAQGIIKEGLLHQAHLTIQTATSQASLHMDLVSGVNQERYQVTADGNNYELQELTQLTKTTQETKQEFRGNDWETTLTKRGFQPMFQAFLDAISGKSADLKQEKVLESHQLCQTFLEQLAVDQD